MSYLGYLQRAVSEGSEPNGIAQDDESIVSFHYIKANDYREVYASGAHGGLTPGGEIHFVLYNERGPIPLLTAQQLSDDGKLSPEIKERRISRDGIVRSVEVGVYLSAERAAVIGQWLIEKAQQVISAQRADGDDN